MCTHIRIFLFFLFLYPAIALPSPGLSYYAMMHKGWDCESSLLALSKEEAPAISILWGTFGEEGGCLKRFLSDPRPKTLEVHLVNEVCQRNSRCGPYEFLRGMSVSDYEKKLLARDEKLLRRFRDLSGSVADFLHKNTAGGPLTCYISPGLESNISRKAARVLFEIVGAHFPQCKKVWNPLNSSPYAKPFDGHVFEQHGNKPRVSPPCIVNLDGIDVGSVDPERYINKYKQCDLVFLWGFGFNGNKEGGQWQDPREREFPKGEYFQSMSQMLHPVAAGGGGAVEERDLEVPEVSGCRRMLNPHDGDGGFVWKVADRHPGDNRSPRIAWLSPPKFQKVFRRVEVISKGKTFDRLTFRHAFTEHGRPYRNIYDSSKEPKTFPLNSTLKADGNCFRLQNPTGRID